MAACIPMVAKFRVTSPSPTSVKLTWDVSDSSATLSEGVSRGLSVHLSLVSLDDFLEPFNTTAILPGDSSSYTFTKLEEYTQYRASIRLVTMATISPSVETTESTEPLSKNIRTRPSGEEVWTCIDIMN